FPGLHVEAGYRVQQGTQIRLLRVTEDVVQGAALHHLPMIHDDDLISHVGHDAEVVGDHQYRHAEFGLQVLDEFKDLGLDRDIERRGGLVGNQQGRSADQSHGDHGALPQPAGQLESIGPHGALRIGEANEAQHLGRDLATFRRRGLSVQVQGLGDLVADRVQRAQRGHRLLENDRYAAALELAHRTAARAQLRNVDWRRGRERIEEPDAATGNARNAGQDSHDALADDGLARTRLSHQSYGAPLGDAEADAIDR